MEDDMTTALATDAQPRALAAPKVPLPAGGAISALVPQDLDQAWRMATALAQAGDMVPKHFQGNPNAIMAALARGMEIGLAPMQSLASIAVINGRASLWGDALPALMQRAGHHVDVDYEGQGDALTAVATLTRGDTGRVIVRRFGMSDAKRAGLLGKPGPWTQYPARMLAMRARAWAIRDGAADALMGLSIADEAADAGPDTARDVTPDAPRPGRAVYRDTNLLDDVIDAPTLTDEAADALAAEARAESDRLAGGV
jgi:hypothetical protein